MRRITACAVAILLGATTVHAAPQPESGKAPPKAPDVPATAPDEGEDQDAEEAPAVPDDGEQQGTIVQLEREVAYIDLGATHGLRPGAGLQVLRTISVRHPYTKQQLLDYFPIGRITIEQVSRVLSYGRLDKRITGIVKVGDVVRIIAPRSPTATPVKPASALATATASKPPTATAGPASKPADSKLSARELAKVELGRLFELSRGLKPGLRAQLLADYLTAHPDSPHADLLREEIVTFRNLEQALVRARNLAQSRELAEPRLRTADEFFAEKQRNRRRLDILASLPRELEAGAPVELAIAISEPALVKAVFAYVRRPDANSYDRFSLAADGDGYFRARLPANLVRPPSMELFLEAYDLEGNRVTAGTALEPTHVQIAAHTEAPAKAPPRSSEIRGFVEYVDFNRFKGNDYYVASQGDFTYRPGTWLAGVSGGFGVLYGRGGKNDVLQQLTDSTQCGATAPANPPPPCGNQAGFNYGYLELEFQFGRWISVAPRLMIGQTVQGPGGGGELKLRIGQATATNLQLGVSYFSNFGALGSLQLEWNVVKGWPMGAAVVVTNQPAEGDVGVRIFYQIAYRKRPWLQPALRVGVAARNIEQIGLNLGLGLITAW